MLLALPGGRRMTNIIPIEQKKYQVLGIDISAFSTKEFYKRIEQRLSSDDPDMPPSFVVTVNPEIVIQSIIDNDFKEILLNSTMNTADGIGIRWAINFLYGERIERITGSDSVRNICAISAKTQQSVFLYGAMPTIASKAAAVLQDEIPDLKIAGSYSPRNSAIPLEDLPSQIQTQLQSASVLFVALGAPDQEKWIYENMDKLSSCKLVIGIGGSFDFIAGNVKRAPEWMCEVGLEWLYRLYLQPVRWKRMIKLPLFALNILLLKSSIEHIQNVHKT